MLVTEESQVTIPKHIRIAAGVAPGSEVKFSPEGSRIVITKVREDRRAALREAASRTSLASEFRPLGADAIMAFLRRDAAAAPQDRARAASQTVRRGSRG